MFEGKLKPQRFEKERVKNINGELSLVFNFALVQIYTYNYKINMFSRGYCL